jgi:aspartyl-tRNA(Asn)/glutamyl-tRNA(Gln) amidotransferase subunit B
MEKGQMRCEVNISLNMGTKVEIKNLNSFRAVEKVIDYEISRQTEILSASKGRNLASGGERGGEIEQETRGWDDGKEKTFSQRKKEEAHDYRYFPEPDLPSLDLRKSDFAHLLSEVRLLTIPELPQQKRERFKKEFNLKNEQIEILVRDKQLSDFFEETISEFKEAGLSPASNPAELVFNYLTSDLIGLMNEKYLTWNDLQISPHAFGELMALISENKISSRVAKDILKIMVETGKDAEIIVREQGLEQTSDKGFIEEIVKKIIEINPKAVSDYKKGKEEAIQFLIGQAMKETKGRINPETLKNIFEKNI